MGASSASTSSAAEPRPSPMPTSTACGTRARPRTGRPATTCTTSRTSAPDTRRTATPAATSTLPAPRTTASTGCPDRDALNVHSVPGGDMAWDRVLCQGYSDAVRVRGLLLRPVSYTHLRAHETDSYLVCRL